MELSPTDKEILAALDERSGLLTRRVAANITYCNHNNRMRSAAVRAHLDALKRRGLVEYLDNEKPVCWKLTPVGAAALAESQRIEFEYQNIHRRALGARR